MIGRRGGQAELPEMVEALDQAIDLAEGRLGDDPVAFGRHVVDKVNGRLGHTSTHTLVALLGATGGGKSSLTNAIVGSDIATTGIRRPTTSSTLACYWGTENPQSLLDWLEVPNRHHVGASSSASLDGLVLLDVPDHDSVEAANRQEMERIAEHADLLVWVTDAEKYADKAMHSYLRGLSRHGAVITMVLNKADQLDDADLAACRSDLARLLASDGLDDTVVVTTSTTTGAGIDDLVKLLAETVESRRAMIDRLEADVSAAAADLFADLGADEGSGKVPRGVAGRLASELVDASGLDAVCGAVAAGHKRDAATRTGWPFTRWARSLRPHPLRRLHLGTGTGGRASLPEPSGVQQARTEGAVRTAVRQVTESMPQPWPEVVRDAATPDMGLLDDRIDQAIAESVRGAGRRHPRWWSLVNVIQLGLAAAALVGAVWLALLAFGAYLRLPDVPTPDVRGIPVPTGLLVGGVVIGLLLAVLSRRLASVGAARRSRAVRKQATDAVGTVAAELVVAPMENELERRHELRRLLQTAGATRGA